MSRHLVQSLMGDLRRAGVVLEPAGDKLRVYAPKGLVTPEILQSLRELKPDLLGALGREARVLAMSLAEFEHQENAIELRVPWLAETLWFVPRREHAAELAGRGIARGRVWTARELIDLISVPGISREDIARIGRLKAGLGAEIVSVEPELGHNSRR